MNEAAAYEDALAKARFDLSKKTDPDEIRLRDRLVETIQKIRPEYQTYYTIHKGKASVSVWLPLSSAIIIMRVGREYIMEVYARRANAPYAIGILERLMEDFDFRISQNVRDAVDRWSEGRTLASKGYDR